MTTELYFFESSAVFLNLHLIQQIPLSTKCHTFQSLADLTFRILLLVKFM